ncbi:MAG: archaetidylserine decarboxylase [Deferrisomatales bacterium]
MVQRGDTGERPSVWDALRAAPQYVLPHHLLSAAMERLTRTRARWFKDPLIRWFSRAYRVDWDEARFRSPGAYPDFNAFFTRELRPGTRPVAAKPGAVVSPVDAAVSQAGRADGGTLFQAKGRTFDLVRLLGGSADRAAPFRGGNFATLYLSPRDYHRIHMPVAGTLREMVCVPGRLFSVSPATTRVVPELFARNERVVAVFETEAGPLALVLVGAVFVGSIETVWHGVVTPPRRPEVQRWEYPAGDVRLARGQELGRFNMGSTVILVFGKDAVSWDPGLDPDRRVRMGEHIGELGPQGTTED